MSGIVQSAVASDSTPAGSAAHRIRRVLLVHNRYRKGAPAGEDNAFDQEKRLLIEAGLEVSCYERSNDEVSEANPWSVLATAAGMRYSRRGYRDVRAAIARNRPQLVHFHNTFPLVSASAYFAAREAGLPVIQTLHNYRLLCSGATLYREGSICRLCTPKDNRPAIRHRCYRNLAGSLMVSRMLSGNWSSGVYQTLVDRYISLTQFAARQFIEAGIPASKVAVKPNFVRSPPAPGTGSGGYVLFASKLAEEKGIRTLLRAWRMIDGPQLHIVGSGPLEAEVRELASSLSSRVVFHGMCSRDRVVELMRDAALVAVPSEWFEGFPLVIVEAYACGTPVVASDIGALAEVVRPGLSGGLFRTGDPASLVEVVNELLADGSRLRKLRATSRAMFESEYSEDRNLSQLMTIYDSALDSFSRDATS